MATQALKCERHGEATRLTCVECGKPICPKCAVRTDVGLKCEADAKGVELSKETLAMLRPSRTPLYLGLAGIGVLLALVIFGLTRSGDDGETNVAQLPAVGTWTASPDLVSIRGTTTAVVLKDGRALAIGAVACHTPDAGSKTSTAARPCWPTPPPMASIRPSLRTTAVVVPRMLTRSGLAVQVPTAGSWATLVSPSSPLRVRPKMTRARRTPMPAMPR